MVDKEKKQALATVFGIATRDGLVHGVPGGVPLLRKAVTCTTCKIELVKGVPKVFAEYMTDEQKAQYKELIGYVERTSRKSKKTEEASTETNEE